MYAPILATLGYVLSGDGLSVLMVHRNARPQDHAYGKYNGLGGKMEPGESTLSLTPHRWAVAWSMLAMPSHRRS